MGISLQDFKSRVGDVARPNRFLFTITPPTGGDSETVTYLCKSAQIPARALGEIPLNWQGQVTKIAGDPTFDDFNVTFLNDYEQRGRKMFEAWMKLIANQGTNERTAPSEYRVDALVQLLGRRGEVIATYKAESVWPKSLDAVDLSMDNTDQASEFGITFGLDTWDRV